MSVGQNSLRLATIIDSRYNPSPAVDAYSRTLHLTLLLMQMSSDSLLEKALDETPGDFGRNVADKHAKVQKSDQILLGAQTPRR